MKKWLTLTLLLFCIPALVWGWGTVIISGGSSGGSNCDTSTDEIGYRTIGGSNGIPTTESLYCNLFVPDCSGPLNTAYIYHGTTATDNVRVYVYEDDGDDSPDNGDSLIAYTSTITSSSVEWASGSLNVHPSVSTSSKYWVCIVSDSTQWPYYYDAEEKTQYYQNISGSFTTPPSDLSGTWGSNGLRKMSVYITIGD